MKKIIALTLLCVFCSCSTVNRSEVSGKDKRPEFAIKINKLSKFKKLDNWNKEYWHQGILFSADGLKLANNNDGVSNRVFIYVTESELSIYDYIKKENENWTQNYNDYKVDVELKETRNGTCYVESVRSRRVNSYYKELNNYYKYKGNIYVVSYRAEIKHYDLYLDEAKSMMNSFEIIKNQ